MVKVICARCGRVLEKTWMFCPHEEIERLRNEIIHLKATIIGLQADLMTVKRSLQ
jgi:hypothetical protein